MQQTRDLSNAKCWTSAVLPLLIQYYPLCACIFLMEDTISYSMVCLPTLLRALPVKSTEACLEGSIKALWQVERPWAPRQSTQHNWSLNNGYKRVERCGCISVNPI